MKQEIGVQVMKDGKAWGTVYEDGHSCCYGWMSPDEAPIHNPKFTRKPESVTYKGSPDIKELRKGKLVNVIRTTTTAIGREI